MDSDARDRIIRELEHEFNRLFVRRRFNALQLARRIDSQIEPASYSVLATLQQHGPQRMTSIARHLGIGKPTLSRQLSVLTSRGFITKTTDTRDRRAQVVSLSAEGRTRLEEAQENRAARYRAMLETWPQEDIETLSGLLAQMNRTYAQYDSPESPERQSLETASEDPDEMRSA